MIRSCQEHHTTCAFQAGEDIPEWMRSGHDTGAGFVMTSSRANDGGVFDVLTSTTSAESAVPVAAGDADSDDLAVHVLGVVGVDVASTAAAVRNFGGRHVGRRQKSLSELVGWWFVVRPRRSTDGLFDTSCVRADGRFVGGTRVPGKEQLRLSTAKTLAIKQAASPGCLDELDSQRMPSLQTTLDSPPPIGRFDSHIMSPSHPLATMYMYRDCAR